MSLNTQQVRKIRSLRAKGLTLRQIAEQFAVPISLVFRVVKNAYCYDPKYKVEKRVPINIPLIMGLRNANMTFVEISQREAEMSGRKKPLSPERVRQVIRSNERLKAE